MGMNCETFKQNIDALLDGELSDEMRQEMNGHAEECGECADRLMRAIEISRMCAEMNEGLAVPLPAQAAWRKAVRAEAKKKPMNAWMRSVAGAAAALLVLVGGTFGVRMGESAPAAAPTVVMAEYGMYDSLVAPADHSFAGETLAGRAAAGGVYLQSDGSAQTGMRSTEDAAESGVELIVLRSAARSIRSDAYDSDVQWLNDLVSEYGAYFEERTENAASDDGLTGRISNAVIRVPGDRLDDFLMELDQLGETLARSESAEDVTDRYADTQSRADALKMQKQKLSEMMAEAETVEELIAIDDKLTEVIASLETLEGDIRRWESLRAYSRVSITMTETVKAAVRPEPSLGLRMKAGFEESVVWLKEFGQDALVTLAMAVPKLVIFVPAIVLIVVVLCAVRRRKRG